MQIVVWNGIYDLMCSLLLKRGNVHKLVPLRCEHEVQKNFLK